MLENVSWISLQSTKLGEDIADSISRMKSRKLAYMRDVQFGVNNATALASLPKLETLRINSNLASDASIEKLAASQTIQDLGLFFASVKQIYHGIKRSRCSTTMASLS